MSTDNINLEDMVEKTLESTGVLPKIRAELRANVYHILEKGSAFQDKLYTRKIKDFVSNKNGALLLSLVKDLFERLELTFTKSVFDSETGAEHQYQYKDEKDIFEELSISKDDKRPILLQILESYQSYSKSTDNVVKNYTSQHCGQTYHTKVSPAEMLQNSVDIFKVLFDHKPKSLSPIKTNVLEQIENHTNSVSSSSNLNLSDNIQLNEIENSESLNSLSIEQLSPIKRLSIDGNDNSDKDVKSDIISIKNESSLEDIETDENVSCGNDSLPSTDLSMEDGSPEMIKTRNIHL